MITITDDNDVVLYFLHYAPNKGNDIHLIIAEVIQPPTGIVYFKDEIGNTTRATISAGLYNLTLELYGSDGNALKRQMSQLRINKTKPYIEVVN